MLNDKIAIVTGTGPNIGSGLALGLAREGAIVACNDIRPEQVDKALARLLSSLNAWATSLPYGPV